MSDIRYTGETTVHELIELAMQSESVIEGETNREPHNMPVYFVVATGAMATLLRAHIQSVLTEEATLED